MGRVEGSYRITLPLAPRLYLWAFGAFWVGLALWLVIDERDATAVTGAAFAAVAVVFMTRTARIVVEARTDGLFIRNFTHTLFLRWDEIEGLRWLITDVPFHLVVSRRRSRRAGCHQRSGVLIRITNPMLGLRTHLPHASRLSTGR